VPLPYRGPGPGRPDDLPLPPARMRGWRAGRPLKHWRYVGVYGPALSLCAGIVHVGPSRQAFWAVWDRERGELHERTVLRRGGVVLDPGSMVVRDRGGEIDLAVEESEGVEIVSPHGRGYIWTRKQGGVRAHGSVVLDGVERQVDGRAMIDDSAGYHARRTTWSWSAGVGATTDGREVAWNLVDGVHDSPRDSERTVWVDGVPREADPVAIAPSLDAVGELAFHAEATREHRQNLLLVRSRYRQPFGTFSGRLPDGSRLTEGYGVMEEHDAWW
jgi:Domain of unknown function (DUF2804), C-terminal